jgi:hypothetical protein
VQETMSNSELIVSKLENSIHSDFVIRDSPVDDANRGPAPPFSRLPEELKWFIQRYSQIEICSRYEPPRNGWIIDDLTWWPRDTVNRFFNCNSDEYKYFEDVWRIAGYAFDGGEIIAIDLHPGSNFGYIGWVTQTDLNYGGGAIVIARSFFEWLERTLDHGAEAQLPYWRVKGFKDYGPLIPDDPYYQPTTL